MATPLRRIRISIPPAAATTAASVVTSEDSSSVGSGEVDGLGSLGLIMPVDAVTTAASGEVDGLGSLGLITPVDAVTTAASVVTSEDLLSVLSIVFSVGEDDGSVVPLE